MSSSIDSCSAAAAAQLDEMQRFDEFARQLMTQANAPGLQLAVAKGAHLKYFKAFGLANTHTQQPVTTNSVFRYYSVSKTITGTAILKLVQEGRLRLDDKPFIILKDVAPPKNADVDPRLLNMTVQHLLQHTGGWNESFTGFVNPIFMPSTLVVSNSLGTQVPASAYDQIRFIKGVPLNFDPGMAFEYSNTGYNILGRVIEKVTGMKYKEYIQEHVFEVAGLKKGQVVIAQSREEDLQANEVRYYGIQGKDELIVSVFPGEGYVASSYGIADYSQADAEGGWVGSARDILKFMVHIDGLRKPTILTPHMVSSMIYTPRPPVNIFPTDNLSDHISLGLQWVVGEVLTRNRTITALFDPNGKSASDSNDTIMFIAHAGAAPGAHSLLIRLIKEEISMAFLLNTAPSDTSSFDVNSIVNFTSLATSIQNWPQDDLFSY